MSGVRIFLWEADDSSMGMGRYQWFIFFLCGFGYFLDLCWAQAGGLVGPAIQAELGVPGELLNLPLFTCLQVDCDMAVWLPNRELADGA